MRRCLGSQFFSKSVKIKDLKPGMMLADEFYEDKEGIKKRSGSITISYIAGLLKKIKQRDVFIEASGSLTKEEVREIKKLHSSGKIKDKEVRVYQTLPFAPFMFFGVILTLIFKGNFIIGLRVVLGIV